MSSGGYVVFFSFAPTYRAGQGMASAEAGLLVSILLWLTIVTIPLGGYIVDRTGRGGTAIWAGGLPALAGWLHELTGNVETAIWFSAICLVLSPLSRLAFRYWQRR